MRNDVNLDEIRTSTAKRLEFLQSGTPIPAWVFDLDYEQMLWVNEPALELWDAPDAESLTKRDFASDMSDSTRARLQRYREGFSRGELVSDQWTLYPRGRHSITADCRCAGFRLEDDRTALLVLVVGERIYEKGDEPELLRGVEALRHSTALVALLDYSGDLLMTNPSAAQVFGTERFDNWFLDPHTVRNRLNEARRHGTSSDEVEAGTGEQLRWYWLKVRTTRDPVSGKECFLIEMHDITRRRAAEQTLRDRERRLRGLSASLQEVLDHMHQAIVVFNAEGRLEGVASRKAHTLFPGETIEGAPLVELLYPNAPEYDVRAQALTEWIDAVMGMPRSTWDDFISVAPEEASIEDSGETRILRLEFRPMEADSDLLITRIMLLATDVTDEYQYRRAVEIKSQKQDEELRAIRRLLVSGSHQFVDFVEAARKRLHDCLASIRESETELTAEEVNHMFQVVHSVRAESASFGIRSMHDALFLIEDRLSKMQRHPGENAVQATGSDFGTIRHGVRTAIEAAEHAVNRFVDESPIGSLILDQVTVRRSEVLRLLTLTDDKNPELHQAVEKLLYRPFAELSVPIQDSVVAWAERESKKIAMKIEGGEILLPPNLHERLGSVLGHLVRNAIAHGIETPSSRTKSGKSSTGTISLNCSLIDEQATMEVSDDGSGLDIERITQLATALGIEKEQPSSVIFLDTFSTSAKSDKSLAGRGVGLPAAKRLLSEVDYELTVDSKRGEGTRFRIFPKKTSESQGTL
ncbi:MAG: ATP-binding protein [Myxococcota bacterium]